MPLLAALLRLAALRWLGVCVILLTPLLNSASTASAHELEQIKTRVGGFESAAPLHIWLNGPASERRHLGNLRCEPEVASESLLAAKGATAAERTVLGKFPDYVNLAEGIGARRFSIPTNVWNKMSPAEQWVANERFLDGTIARGDDIILSNPVKNIGEATGWFGRELRYLADQGYRLAEDGARMVR